MKTRLLILTSTLCLLTLWLTACAHKTATRDFTPSKINVGTTANDGTGDTLRLAMMKINTNFTAISNQFVLLQTMVATASNSLLTAVSASTNALASTNNLNSVATVVSNMMLTTMSTRDAATSNSLLTAITVATNAFASTNLLNAGIASYSNTVATLLGAKAPTNAPTLFNATHYGTLTLNTNTSSAPPNVSLAGGSGWSTNFGEYKFNSTRSFKDTGSGVNLNEGGARVFGASSSSFVVSSSTTMTIEAAATTARTLTATNITASVGLTAQWLNVTNSITNSGSIMTVP